MARPKPTPTFYLRSRALAGSPAGRLLVRVSAFAALLLVTGMVMRQARAQAYRLADYRLGPASVVYEDLPGWVDAPLRAVLTDRALLPIHISVFDPLAEAHVRAVLSRHPLVRRVTQVRVIYPRRVAVQVVLRTPACFVETPVKHADGRPFLMLLSTDGHPLDERCYEGFLALKPTLPVVSGVEISQPPVPGVPWDNLREQVAEGLASAQVAERLARDLGWGRSRHVARIDVSRFPARDRREGGEVLLGLSDGTLVEWGRTERDLVGAVEEDGYETKMRRLSLALTLGQTRKIDVRYPTDPLLAR